MVTAVLVPVAAEIGAFVWLVAAAVSRKAALGTVGGLPCSSSCATVATWPDSAGARNHL